MCVLSHLAPLLNKEIHELCFIKQIIFSSQYVHEPLIGEMFWEVHHWVICQSSNEGGEI